MRKPLLNLHAIPSERRDSTMDWDSDVIAVEL